MTRTRTRTGKKLIKKKRFLTFEKRIKAKIVLCVELEIVFCNETKETQNEIVCVISKSPTEERKS